MNNKNQFWTRTFVVLMLLSCKAFSQPQKYQITGTLKGGYFGKIYLFFEGDFRRKDSISSTITNGHFNFKGVATLPILARIHLGQNSYIIDVYLDSPKLAIDCINIPRFSNDNKDTVNKLTLIRSKGSSIEKDRRNFEIWNAKLRDGKASDEVKQELLFKKLSAFVRANSKSKVSPYLIGKADGLSHNQVSELYKLLDPSLENTYEVNTVRKLLVSLDRSKFWKPGMAFYDVDLPDTSGNVLSTGVRRNKYTFYVFWASWCKPCRIEHPGLRAFYYRNKNKGLEIVSISLDKVRQKWTEAIRKDSLPWTQLSDLSGAETEICQYYDITEIPVSFFVDGEGKIIGTNMSVSEMESIINQ